MFIMNVNFTGKDSAAGGSDSLVIVRSIEPRDAPAVTLLIQQLGYNRPEAEVLRWIEDFGSIGPRQAVFVACLCDEVIGWIEISIEHRLQSPPFALIGGLVVKDGLRGQGIGRRLCLTAEAWSWEQGVSTVRVTSRSTRIDAHRFYLNDGYESVKVSQVFEKRRQE
jgi:GNAT superfamily N-acetyltransferase